jgi:hypothetical protein
MKWFPPLCAERLPDRFLLFYVGIRFFVSLRILAMCSVLATVEDIRQMTWYTGREMGKVDGL